MIITEFTNQELAKEAAREAGMRKEVYARKGMTPLLSRRIRMMEVMAEHFQELSKEEPSQGDFFERKDG